MIEGLFVSVIVSPILILLSGGVIADSIDHGKKLDKGELLLSNHVLSFLKVSVIVVSSSKGGVAGYLYFGGYWYIAKSTRQGRAPSLWTL